MAAALMFLIGCSDSKVVLQGTGGGKKLVYDPNNFQPQVETPEDIAILIQAAAETMTNAASAQSIVTVQEISDAIDASDWRKLERVVVEYRVAHRKQCCPMSSEIESPAEHVGETLFREIVAPQFLRSQRPKA
jgi:hypothetical protein